MAQTWVNPVTGTVGQGPGYRSAESTNYVGSTNHQGYDIRAPEGTQVVAATGGTVTRAEYSSSYGNVVYVTQADGSQQRYAHLSSLDVSRGDQVSTGDNIGEVGATGNATGPHLHYENRGPDGSITGNATGDDSLNRQYERGNRVTGGEAGDGTTTSNNSSSGKQGDGTGDNTKKSDQEATAKKKSPIDPTDKNDIKGTSGNYQKTQTKSITSIMPTHEPWPGHPKSTEGPRQALQGGQGTTGSNGRGGSNNNASDGRVGNFQTPGKFSEKSPAVMQRLMDRYNLTDYQAAGILGNLGHESVGFTAYQERNPVGGGRGGAGWAQWTGSRRTAFENYAASRGLDPRSDEANMGYLERELDSPQYQSTMANLRGTTNLTDATQVFENGFEKAGVKAYPSRNRYANDALNSYQKQKGKKPPTADPGQNKNNSNQAPSPSNSTPLPTTSTGTTPQSGTSTAPQAAAQTPTPTATPTAAVGNFGLTGPISF